MSASSSLSPSVNLLNKEYRKFHRKPHQFMKAYELQDDNVSQWIVYVVGPPGTLYEGGVFRTLIRFPDSFPIDPPSVQFLSEFWHPNVYRDGKVCISTLQHPIPDYLRDDEDPVPVNSNAGFWSPANGTETIFMSVISLLSDPNPDDPANSEAATMYVNDRAAFAAKVAACVAKSKANKPDDLEMDNDEPQRELTSQSIGVDDCTLSDEEFDFESGSEDGPEDDDGDMESDNGDDDDDVATNDD